MLTKPLTWYLGLALFSVAAFTACETQSTSDSGVCVPISGELCVAPLSVWVEDNDLLREVVGTGACSFQTPPNSGGVSRIDGVLRQSGTCHIVATAVSGAIDEQDVEIGTLVQSAYCGCANYRKEGALRVLAFSKRKPTFGPDGSCQCPENRYCTSGATRCSPNPGNAQCALRPTACSTEVQPVCGCDGMIYTNECLAYQAGTQVALANACTLPATQFACGDVICTRDVQLCLNLYSPKQDHESYRCENGLACRKAFSETCGCPSGATECTCETLSTGAVICRSKV